MPSSGRSWNVISSTRVNNRGAFGTWQPTHVLDVCETENQTRDTTHGGASLTAPVVACRKRPFTTHADRLRARLEGGRLPVAGPAARRAIEEVKGVGAPRATRARGAVPRLGPPASSARLRGRALPPSAHDPRRIIWEAARFNHIWASTLSCGTPSPLLYMTPRLFWAEALPCSAARRYHRMASASSCGMPSPLSYMTPRL